MTASNTSSESEEDPPIPLGGFVYDEQEEEPNTAVVIHRPGDSAKNHYIESMNKTVAEANTDYPPDADVVFVAFESDLEEIDAWKVSTPESLFPLVKDEDIRYYAYPAPRLWHDGEYAVTPRTTDDGDRYIHRLHITNIGEQLAFGLDYDGVDHQHGTSRKVCFHHKNRDIPEDAAIHLEYEREKHAIDDLPPLLVGISDYKILEGAASPDFLLDL